MRGRIKEWDRTMLYYIVVKPTWSDPYDSVKKRVVNLSQDDTCDQFGRVGAMCLKSSIEYEMVTAIVMLTSGSVVSQVRENINKGFNVC